MSLDFGNKNTRRRQFYKDTVRESYDHPKTQQASMMFSHSPHIGQQTHQTYQQRDQTALMNMSMNSQTSKRDMEQLFNATGRSNMFATMNQSPIAKQ